MGVDKAKALDPGFRPLLSETCEVMHHRTLMSSFSDWISQDFCEYLSRLAWLDFRRIDHGPQLSLG